MDGQHFGNLDEFYPYYLSQHANRLCRRMHFIGSSSALASVVQFADSGNPWWLLFAPVSGYCCAWIGHYLFEKNKPATFGHPFLSFVSDWKMYWQMLTGKLTW